jgi:hypothetical protein
LREPIGGVEMRQDEVLEAREIASCSRRGFEAPSAMERSSLPVLMRNRNTVLAASVAHRHGNHEAVSGR